VSDYNINCSRCDETGFDRNSVLPDTPAGHWDAHTWLCVDCDWTTPTKEWERVMWDRMTGVRVTA